MPPSRRLIVRAGFREVVGYDLGRGRRRFREARLERLSGARVQHLPLSAQQAAVRRVAHQRVLEQVAVPAAREHQFGHGQLRQGLVQRRLRQVGDRRRSPRPNSRPITEAACATSAMAQMMPEIKPHLRHECGLDDDSGTPPLTH